MRVTVLGYLSRDRNVLPDGQINQTVGGKGLFVAAALAQCGVETDLITWLPPTDAELALALKDYAVALHVVPMTTGTINTNAHSGDQTISTTKFDPTPIEPAQLNDGMRQAISQSDLVVVAPDIQEKISRSTLSLIANDLGLPVIGDIGKYFKTIADDGRLVSRYPWPDQAQFLPNFSTIFMSREDLAAPFDAGESFLSLARHWHESGPVEIIITNGSHGSFIYDGGTNEAFEVPAYAPRQLIDPTGAGDTYLGAYLAERHRTENPLQAGKFAAMAASLKLNYVGPLRETAEEIQRALDERENPT